MSAALPYNVESPIKICVSFRRAKRSSPFDSSRSCFVHVFPGPRYFPSARFRFFPSDGNIYFRPEENFIRSNDEFFGKESRRNKAWRISSRHVCALLLSKLTRILSLYRRLGCLIAAKGHFSLYTYSFRDDVCIS